MCVPSAFGTAGNIVKIIDALDLKGYMSSTFDEGEVASWITDFWEVNNPTIIQAHEITSSALFLPRKRYPRPQRQTAALFRKVRFCPHRQSQRRKRAGLPTTSAKSATSRVTT